MFPIVICSFWVMSLISVVVHLVKSGLATQKAISRFIIVLLFSAFFLPMYAGILCHGGIHLMYEKEADAISMQGNITEIAGLGMFSFPRLDSDYGYGDTHGVQFVINGEVCCAPTKGSLNTGDYVEILYLPNSKYILSIQKSVES